MSRIIFVCILFVNPVLAQPPVDPSVDPRVLMLTNVPNWMDEGHVWDIFTQMGLEGVQLSEPDSNRPRRVWLRFRSIEAVQLLLDSPDVDPFHVPVHQNPPPLLIWSTERPPMTLLQQQARRALYVLRPDLFERRFQTGRCL